MPENPYVANDGQKWAQPTREELRPGHPVHEAVVEQLEAWHPNYSTDGRVTSYDDWVERVEGLEFPGDPETKMELGADVLEHPFKTVRRIAQKLAKELR